jgi:uncharacterized membrane protein
MSMNPDQLRREWVARVMEGPGLEILAVQTLRNSIMAATVMASTSALGLMGLLSLVQLRGVTFAGVGERPAQLLLLLPLLLLALCVVEFSQSVRLYHRCSYLVALTQTPDGQGVAARDAATTQLLRASRLYRAGWWTFYGAMAAGACAMLV